MGNSIDYGKLKRLADNQDFDELTRVIGDHCIKLETKPEPILDHLAFGCQVQVPLWMDSKVAEYITDNKDQE